MPFGHGGGGGLQEFMRGAFGYGGEIGEDADFAVHGVFVHGTPAILPIRGPRPRGAPAASQRYACRLGCASLGHAEARPYNLVAAADLLSSLQPRSRSISSSPMGRQARPSRASKSSASAGPQEPAA